MRSNNYQIILYVILAAVLIIATGCSSSDDCCCSEDTSSQTQTRIIVPFDDTVFDSNIDSVMFIGSIADADDSEEYRWISSVDGEIGNGSEIELSPTDLSTGVHQITMEAYRQGVLIGTDVIAITITDETSVNSPPDTFLRSTPPESYFGNYFVRFVWEGVDPDGDTLSFQYRLEGPVSTNGWISTTALENEKICINISGDYIFIVMAIDQTQLADPTPEVYRFEADALCTCSNIPCEDFQDGN